MVNMCLNNDTFPQPTPEALFSKIPVGKKFSKLDLSQAYLQMQLEEQSHKYLTISFQRTKAIYENALRSKTGKWKISKIY